MFEIVLHQPEIPPNTGNIMRLAANTGCRLHLVRPLGFRLDDRTLARAGMDYRNEIELTVHQDWRACASALGQRRMFALSTRGLVRYDCVRYGQSDALLFGAETHGLPRELLEGVPAEQRVYIPMTSASRSLNLANAVAVVVYEAWRQIGFRCGPTRDASKGADRPAILACPTARPSDRG